MLLQTRERLDRLRDSAGDPSPADLSKIVQTDPFLSYLLLKAVNNRQRGQFSSEVIGIENALKLVGVQRFLEQFGHLPVIEERFASGSAEYSLLLQQIMIARQAAAFAWDWAVARLDLKPEEIYTAALLHNQAWCQLACCRLAALAYLAVAERSTSAAISIKCAVIANSGYVDARG